MGKSYKTLTILATLSLLLSACTVVVTSSEESKEEPKYKVTWKNFDGTVLEIDEDLEAGTVPTYDGKEPTKTQDAQYNYIFDGWSPKVSEVKADAEYVAVFKEETRKYTVTWKNYDGAVLKEEELLYGTTPTYTGETPTKSETVEHTYTFDSWSPAIATVTENATYTASFKEEKRQYNITWKNDDGSVIRTDSVAYGDTPSFGESVPTKESTAQYAYTFDSWTPTINVVTGDAEYQATYTSEVRKYTITWANEDGTVLEVDENVPYGTIPSYNSPTPTKKSVRGVTYEFKGWDSPTEFVKADKTYTAQYNKTGFFSFDPINYEMEEGFTLDDIEGAPWINANIQGELDKIKKPSVKDDFYASVNYENIKYGILGPFEECKATVNNIFSTIYDGSSVNQTTNGYAVKTAFDGLYNGSSAAISNYINGLDVDTYLSTRACFEGISSLLSLTPNGEGSYSVAFNEGYLNGNYTSLPFLWIYNDLADDAKNIVSALSQKLDLGLSSEDIDDIKTNEYNLMYRAYYDGYYGVTTNTYTVGNLTWKPLKDALLDLGLAANAPISIDSNYNNCFNMLYNQYSDDAVKDMVASRIAFDSRFFIGVEDYKEVNYYISQINIYVYGNERNLFYYDNATICKTLLQLAFQELVEQTYIQLASSEETKAQVAELIDEILESYKELAGTSWLGNQTKNRMKTKLDYMKYESCYSDAFRTFKKIGEETDVTSKSSFDIFRLYRSAQVDMILANNVDKAGSFDYMPSYTVNAYYSPGSNSFVILNGLASGMLGTCIEEKLALLGSVIGHEITHAFDSNGSNYDELGNYNNWWTSNDKSVFDGKVANMVDFYKNIKLTKRLRVDGNNVNGEATADMGGVKVALMLAKKEENFDYDLFFKTYAFLWSRQAIPFDNVESRASDEHPFDYLRTNVTVAQFDEFIETYDIQPGDGMYIPEDQRVKIW